MEFSDEENNQEEKKESNDEKLLFYSWFEANLVNGQTSISFNYFYFESEATNTFDIILPPPERRG